MSNPRGRLTPAFQAESRDGAGAAVHAIDTVCAPNAVMVRVESVFLSRARRTRWAGDDPTESMRGDYFIVSA